MKSLIPYLFMAGMIVLATLQVVMQNPGTKNPGDVQQLQEQVNALEIKISTMEETCKTIALLEEKNQAMSGSLTLLNGRIFLLAKDKK